MPDMRAQRKQERETRIAREKEEMHRMMESNVFSKMGRKSVVPMGNSPIRNATGCITETSNSKERKTA